MRQHLRRDAAGGFDPFCRRDRQDLGFHSVFQGTPGQPVTNERSAPGNAVMQAYYNWIGIGPQTATFLVSADPTDMLLAE